MVKVKQGTDDSSVDPKEKKEAHITRVMLVEAVETINWCDVNIQHLMK